MSALLDMKQIVVTPDNRSHSCLVLIGVNTRDRPGLLLDISKCLLQLKLQVHRTEAAVHDEQSVSVWRCSNIESKESDAEQILAMLNVRVCLCIAFF
jgi:predicted amino acid-binding ACT domain protein